jgi:hypothetical protein
MVNANNDIFEMSYEESVSYFKRLDTLDKIRRTNGPSPTSLAIDNQKSIISSLGKSSKNPACGFTIVKRTTKTRLIAEQLPNLNSIKRLALKPKLHLERSLWPSFLKDLMHSKGN